MKTANKTRADGQSPRTKKGKRGKRRRIGGCYVQGRGRIRRRKANPTGKRRPMPCYTVGRGRIRRRKLNRRSNPEYFKIWARLRGRTWLWYTGEEFALLKRPRVYVTAKQAMKVARALRRQHPKVLAHRTMVVSTTRPAHDL